jgi:hypothetical protein
MLEMPKVGFNVSVAVHNVRLDALVEWVEGSVAFVSDEVSQSDIADALIEGQVYRDRAFATQLIEAAWTEMRRRAKCLGAAGLFDVQKLRVKRTRDWKATPAYSFCLALALQISYRQQVAKRFGTDYVAQGELFERLTAESLKSLGWSVHSTGWSAAKVAGMKEKVAAIAAHLGEPVLEGGVTRWTKKAAKDAGLDVVCSLPFEDGWGGRPLCLVQCASGEDWGQKLHTPNLRLWEKLVDFTTAPTRGLSMPFAPTAEVFRKAAINDGITLLLDRHRLLAPSLRGSNTWISAALRNDLNKWTADRVEVFPSDDN